MKYEVQGCLQVFSHLLGLSKWLNLASSQITREKGTVNLTNRQKCSGIYAGLRANLEANLELACYTYSIISPCSDYLCPKKLYLVLANGSLDMKDEIKEDLGDFQV